MDKPPYDQRLARLMVRPLAHTPVTPNQLTALTLVLALAAAWLFAVGVIGMLITAGETWGDYSVRMRRPTGGLGNAALRAAGTPEQVEKWRHLTLAMAITEPGCGSDPSRVQTSAVLDGDEWVINGEKIFVTTGCRANGVVVWATIDKSARTIRCRAPSTITSSFAPTPVPRSASMMPDDSA